MVQQLRRVEGAVSSFPSRMAENNAHRRGLLWGEMQQANDAMGCVGMAAHNPASGTQCRELHRKILPAISKLRVSARIPVRSQASGDSHHSCLRAKLYNAELTYESGRGNN